MQIFPYVESVAVKSSFGHGTTVTVVSSVVKVRGLLLDHERCKENAKCFKELNMAVPGSKFKNLFCLEEIPDFRQILPG